MRMLQVCLCAILLISSNFVRSANAEQGKEDPELQRTLNKVDEVSKNFKSFTAKFTQRRYTAILKEFDAPESGEFYYAFAKDKSVMMRHEVRTPNTRITTIKGESAAVYQPAIKQAQVYNLGKRKNLVEYLATGLGQTSAKMREQFYISYQGTEAIQGAPCSMVVLAPKNQSAAASVKSIIIWFKKTTGTPMQYKFVEPTGDYMVETFSNEKLNSKISSDKFETNFPRGTEILKF